MDGQSSAAAPAAAAGTVRSGGGRWHPRKGELRRPYILPQSVCDRAERLCRVHPQITVAELLGIEPATLTRLKQRGFRASVGKRLRPIPADFAIQSIHMSQRELGQHYRAGHHTVARWSKEIDRQPRWRAGTVLPVPARKDVEAAIAAYPTFALAASALGVSATTLRAWRRKLGLDQATATATTLAARSFGWADRYANPPRITVKKGATHV